MQKRIETLADRVREALRHSIGQNCPRSLPGGPDGAAKHVGGRGQDALVAKPAARPPQQRGGTVKPQRLAFEKPGELIGRVGVERAQLQMATDTLLMLGNRLTSLIVRPDGIRTRTQLQSGEPQDLLVDLQRLLAREPTENAHKGNLVGEAKLVVAAPALRDLAPVLLEEGAVADQSRAGDVGVGIGHGSSVKKKRPFRVVRHATRNGTLFLCPSCKIQCGKHGSIDST